MRIIVGMSGGVDSSVAALLLKQQGYEVHGLFMKNWEEDDTITYCSAKKDLCDAQAVCDTLSIPLHTVNFANEYWENVFTYCLHEYQAGRTPNPDVLCNREIKFKVFLDYALCLGGEAIATGHYVRTLEKEGNYQLLKGVDPNKDQSYFLYLLKQSQLQKSYFPLGSLQKSQVRKLATRSNLATQTKKDSTGICFIGERPFRQFLSRFLAARPGKIETVQGKEVGQHEGVIFYTLGQRQGLKIGGQRGGNGQPWFVVAKDIPNNRLIVAQGHDHPLLWSQSVTASHLHWISETPPTLPYSCTAKTRYRQADQACTIMKFKEDGTVHIQFLHPQWAVTPGQSVVFYQGEVCLGGGIIERSGSSLG